MKESNLSFAKRPKLHSSFIRNSKIKKKRILRFFFNIKSSFEYFQTHYTPFGSYSQGLQVLFKYFSRNSDSFLITVEK